ncbi:Viral cathepsin [Eumeta japonica]|uniref:Viral cathepsin n=1 Tax=Eumeta variegata TaxID=151549 RepID=A0A4C1Y2J9_EUMVA|nr:Viral cathepsin [Eumeta japonica]
MKPLYVIISLSVLCATVTCAREDEYDEEGEDYDDESYDDGNDPSSSSSGGAKPYYDVGNADQLFEDFVKKYKKTYKDERDRKEHYDAFVNNLKFLNMANERYKDTTYDINSFADYTAKDRAALLGTDQ